MTLKMKTGSAIQYQFYAVDEHGMFRFGLSWPRSAPGMKLTEQQKKILKDGVKAMVEKWNDLEKPDD